jgi:predicted nucleic acid-binding protein
MVYLDTNVLIYLLEDHPVYGALVADKLTELRNSGQEFATSVLTITELLAGTRSSKDSIIDDIPHLETHNITKAIATKAAMIQRDTGLNIGDSLHLATALIQNADAIFTNDKQLAKTASKYLPITSV